MIYKNSKYISNIFNNVSSKYDFFNNLFSLGLHFMEKEINRFIKAKKWRGMG